MVRRTLVAASLGLLALVVAGTGFATTQSRPSEKSCLVAWNLPANRKAHLRLLAQRPISGVSLQAGQVARDTWTGAGSTTQTSWPACLLTVTKSGRVRMVAGRWHQGQVGHWSWGRWIRRTVPFPATDRLLPGGRLAKIYRH